MATSPAPVRTALALVLVSTSAVVGYTLGAGAAPPPAAPPGFDALAAEVRSLVQQVARLRDAIREPSTTIAAAAPLPPREPAAANGSAARAPAEEPPADRDELLQRLAQRIRTLETMGHAPAWEALQRARLQNPQPNEAAVEQLLQQLQEQPDNEQHRQAVARQVWLLGMAEVVQRLGMPSNVISEANALMWEYFLPGGRSLTLLFRNGVVVRVDN